MLAAFSLTGPVVGFELDLDALLGAPRRDRAFVAPSAFPASSIDLAFVLDDRVSAATVAATLQDAADGMLESVHAFDEFRSDALGDGKRSVAFALSYRAAERTLTDAEVAELRAQRDRRGPGEPRRRAPHLSIRVLETQDHHGDGGGSPEWWARAEPTTATRPVVVLVTSNVASSVSISTSARTVSSSSTMPTNL